MPISAEIADCERLRVDPSRDSPDVDDWCHFDSSTLCNDCFTRNTKVGEAFLAIRQALPPEMARPLEAFLVPICPVVATASRIPTPHAQDVENEACHAALDPEDVKRHLALLEGVDLPGFFARMHESFEGRLDDPFDDQRKLVEFFFMWAAAMGQAASKGWGLLVIVG